jgi:hypothetical protein
LLGVDKLFAKFLHQEQSERLHRILGRLSQASHREDPLSVVAEVMRDLWWKKWHWDRF